MFRITKDLNYHFVIFSINRVYLSEPFYLKEIIKSVIELNWTKIVYQVQVSQHNTPLDIIRELEHRLQREINWRIYSKQEIQKNLKDSGFLQEIFKNKKIFLKSNQHELSKLLSAKSY